jgi:5'-3' exonuclease
MQVGLLDGDILVYRIGWACESEDNANYVVGTLRSFISDILIKIPTVEDYEVFISGSSRDNFRHKYAVTAPYKGNRKDSRKPKWYDFIRETLEKEYDADVSQGEEADDTIAIRATELAGNGVIISVDKDFDQVPCPHYNPVKQEHYEVTQEEGDLNFYCQFLEGDKVDNIIGVKGIGKKGSRQLLEGLTPPQMFDVVAYHLGSIERAVENGRLLYLRRQPNEIWDRPDEI